MGVTDTLHEQVMVLTSDAAIHEFESWIAEAGTDTPLVVAVDGHSAAGKSTFSQRLAEKVDAALVNGDDFLSGDAGFQADHARTRRRC